MRYSRPMPAPAHTWTPFSALLAFGLAGCVPTVRVHVTTPGGIGATDPVEVVSQAGERIGVRIQTSEPGPGVVEFELHEGPDDGNRCGHVDFVLTQEDPCRPKAWSCDESRYAAHELGHVFGLRHQDGTLMQADGRALDKPLTRRQRLIVKAAATTLEHACRE